MNSAKPPYRLKPNERHYRMVCERFGVNIELAGTRCHPYIPPHQSDSGVKCFNRDPRAGMYYKVVRPADRYIIIRLDPELFMPYLFDDYSNIQDKTSVILMVNI